GGRCHVSRLLRPAADRTPGRPVPGHAGAPVRVSSAPGPWGRWDRPAGEAGRDGTFAPPDGAGGAGSGRGPRRVRRHRCSSPQVEGVAPAAFTTALARTPPRVPVPPAGLRPMPLVGAPRSPRGPRVRSRPPVRGRTRARVPFRWNGRGGGVGIRAVPVPWRDETGVGTGTARRPGGRGVRPPCRTAARPRAAGRSGPGRRRPAPAGSPPAGR